MKIIVCIKQVPNTSEVKINPEKATIKTYFYRTVVETVEDEDKEISLEEAKKLKSTYKVGDVVKQEVSTKDFNRIAVQTAKQVITQKIKEIERQSIYKDIAEKESKKGNYRIFDAYSSEKTDENNYTYIWVQFVDFSSERPAFLQPKVGIDAEGELEFTIYNGKENIGCLVKTISQWDKQSSNG